MANRPDPEIEDDDFLELYKEYTGPPGSATTKTQERAKSNKRSNAGSDEDEEPRDPNAVPTDFTSREAKVWEAKSKATERNWKKRKEEEMICKLCGESGHFTQGCPSTLGANRKSQDFFERIPARDKHFRALVTDKVISKIERDIGCKIKMDEKFIIVSGKDRLILAKGVDAVHKIREEAEQRGSSNSQMTRSRSPERSPVSARFQRSEPQRSHSAPRNTPPQYQQRFGRQERAVEDRVREDIQKFAKGSPQAYGNSGAGGRSSRSRSPRQAAFTGHSYNSFDGCNQNMGTYRNDGWDSHRRDSGIQSSHQFDYNASHRTLEELELEYKNEVTELMKIRDREEDEENFMHREAIRDLREKYMSKVALLKATHAKQWEEFLQLETQRHQRQAVQQMSSGYRGFKQQNFPDYDGSTVNPPYAGTNIALESRNRFPDTVEAYPSRPHDNFSEFHRRGDFAKPYNRY